MFHPKNSEPRQLEAIDGSLHYPVKWIRKTFPLTNHIKLYLLEGEGNEGKRTTPGNKKNTNYQVTRKKNKPDS
jgi:hypothetical protein